MSTAIKDGIQRWSAQAPSNIALIKYMGKTDSSSNKPTNRSFSLTLPYLVSQVEIQLSKSHEDLWEPLILPGVSSFKLNEKGIARFLAHAKFLKEKFAYDGHFIVKSNNVFPSDCGLASSASSFAALTLATIEALHELTGKPRPSVAEMADLSRRGSGSSCRSFFAPWALWSETGVEPVEIPYEKLYHQVVVINEKTKQVSSSEAHSRVTSSVLFQGRPERAEKRLEDLIAAFRIQNWSRAFEICWAEFWDMHALFETSEPPFGYMAGGTLEVLNVVRSHWLEFKDGPIATMDAGPNVHLIYRQDQRTLVDRFRSDFEKKFRVICSLDWQRKRGAQ